MKNFIIVSIIILTLISLNCSGKEIAAGERWKEKYGIEPNAGVFTGKITKLEFWKGKKIFVMLTYSRNGELVDYDSPNSNGYFLIKNLKRGRYFIYVNDKIYNLPGGPVGYHMFKGYDCRSFYIDIEPEIIKIVDAESPGSSDAAWMPMIRIEGHPEPKRDSDSCEIKYRYERLNENNYTYRYKLTREDK
jgi:hypothetical protein